MAMPIFQLSHEITFPPPELAESDGLLAVGGDLSRERLLLAYSMGIFPWYSEGSPILWWSPDPRLILIPRELRISRRTGRIMRKGEFDVTIDAAFENVIRACAKIHRNKDGGTWITDEMLDAYTALYSSGRAHSVESWFEGQLVGGLYGVTLGGTFFGESMFTIRSNASKIAFVKLVNILTVWGFDVIDCQVTTRHLISMGAREIDRSGFIRILKSSIQRTGMDERWFEVRGKPI